MFGFGGAFTEASALQFAKLSPEKQEEVLQLYFDKQDGAAYEFGRVPMDSSDFSVSSYSCDDVPNDTSMSHLDDGVEHDSKVLIPSIQRALEENPALKMFLAQWSPPAWMKRAREEYVPSMLGSALPVGLRDDARSAWELYFSKFISAYKSHDVRFWGLSSQNEPEFAALWEACGYNASFEAEFVANHLGNNCDAPIIIDDTDKDDFVQPMYYSIKHFSKYVPPGSRRIRTDVSATFKTPGDAQLHPNYPVQLHTSKSRGLPYCIDLLRPEWVDRQVTLVECQYTSQSWTFASSGEIQMAGHCLALNHGSTDDGIRLTVHPCRDSERVPHELWRFTDDAMQSLVSSKCVTAGYSFVQSVGFVTRESKKVLVVLNEHSDDAEFELQYGDVALETVIP